MSNGQRWAFIFIGLFGATELAWVAYANNPKCPE